MEQNTVNKMISNALIVSVSFKMEYIKGASMVLLYVSTLEK